MKSAQLSTLLSIPLLLTGCGGGGGGGGGNSTPPVPKYTWQIVSLKSINDSSVAPGCSTLATGTNAGEVIGVYEATDNFKILIHNADGTIETDLNLNGSNKVVISSNDIPEYGYVTLEEIDGSIGGNNDVFMFSVEKEFLSDMTLNVRQHSNSYSCYKGEQFIPIEVNPNAVVKVDQISPSTKYYQTSYVDNAVDGRNISAKIPVKSGIPAQDKILVTLFDSYTSNEATNLTHYTVMAGNSVYDSTTSGIISGSPSETNLLKPTFDALALGALSTTQSSQIDVKIDDDIYTWQRIYQLNQQYSVIDGPSSIESWSFNLAVNAVHDWSGQVWAPVETYGTTISAPTLNAFTANINSRCTSGNHCVLATGFDDSEVQLQRTHIRSHTNNDSRSFYQTIFSTPRSEQVLMESSSEILAPNPADKVEISIAKLDPNANKQVNQFLAWGIDLQSLVSASTPSFHDVNGLISMPSDDKERRISIMGSELQMYRNGVN
ncbi:hypothetical protein [Vibrio scophthalmi]|uniref:Lipoprotein n=1 Tax=Vibrio scophthalmi TaxID=45658 RepID=A0A1C7FD31_9VIBR|nr:hypothetical protein [Vibrio scophthalmi]ANU37648.1 hypothetical protein VSVS05_02570 [Vibrio scophthalmi]